MSACSFTSLRRLLECSDVMFLHKSAILYFSTSLSPISHLPVICLLIHFQQSANKHFVFSPISVSRAFPYRLAPIPFRINIVSILLSFLTFSNRSLENTLSHLDRHSGLPKACITSDFKEKILWIYLHAYINTFLS